MQRGLFTRSQCARSWQLAIVAKETASETRSINRERIIRNPWMLMSLEKEAFEDKFVAVRRGVEKSCNEPGP
jgi:hypothetical protein